MKQHTWAQSRFETRSCQISGYTTSVSVDRATAA